MKNMQKNNTYPIFRMITVLGLCAALLCSCFIGCGKTDDGTTKNSKGLTKVTLNEVAHSIFYAPMYVAIEEGYFADEGIDLTLVTGFGADKTMTALLTGEADIGFMGSESTIYTYIGGTQDYAVNFAQLTQRAGNFLVSREPVSDFSWDMLKGKDVLGGRAGGMPPVLQKWFYCFRNASIIYTSYFSISMYFLISPSSGTIV